MWQVMNIMWKYSCLNIFKLNSFIYTGNLKQIFSSFKNAFKYYYIDYNTYHIRLFNKKLSMYIIDKIWNPNKNLFILNI